jgi:hypothetical protein
MIWFGLKIDDGFEIEVNMVCNEGFKLLVMEVFEAFWLWWKVVVDEDWWLKVVVVVWRVERVG